MKFKDGKDSIIGTLNIVIPKNLLIFPYGTNEIHVSIKIRD